MYKSKVNHERKSLERKHYERKIQAVEKDHPKRWWKNIKAIDGVDGVYVYRVRFLAIHNDRFHPAVTGRYLNSSHYEQIYIRPRYLPHQRRRSSQTPYHWLKQAKLSACTKYQTGLYVTTPPYLLLPCARSSTAAWAKQGVLRERWHSSLRVKIAKHKYYRRRCHDNLHNYRLKCIIFVIIVTGKVFRCFCL